MRSLLLISIITAASAQAVFTNPADLKDAVRHSSCCVSDNEYNNNNCEHNGEHIKNWDVSQITDFSEVFRGQHYRCLQHFNADISKWDVSQGTNFRYMFNAAYAFNADISSWRPNPNLPTDSFNDMFSAAHNFNQNLDDWGLVHHGTANMFRATYSLTHRPYWYTAEASDSCFNNTGCGTCGQRLHSVASEDEISQYGLQTRTVTCSAGVKANTASTSCSSALCVDDNLICCESPCENLDASTCKSNSICWWDTDINSCVPMCSKPIKDHTDRKCADTASSLAGISCGNGTTLVNGECKPACTSEGCVELVEAYKTQCD